LQAKAVAEWIGRDKHRDPERVPKLTRQLADVTGTRITIVAADGLVEGDSLEPSTIGRPIGAAWEVAQARKGETGRAIRELETDGALQYVVAVPGDLGRVIRLSVPVNNIVKARSRMRNRLLVGFGAGFLGALILSWIFVRAISRPIQSVTRTAERLAAGEYDVPPPVAATEAGGELGVLARAMTRMAGEVKARVSELTHQRDLLRGVVGGLVEGVVVVEKSGELVLVNDAARPLVGEVLPDALAPLVRRAQGGDPADDEVELVGRTVRASARPLGEAGAIVVLYDVTRMHALENVRREFLSNAAHELRTPVTAISGYAETLLGGGVDADTSKEFLTTIHRNAQRIAGLVSQLVLLDQLGARPSFVGDRTQIGLAQVVGDAARTAKGVTPSAMIDVDVPSELAVLGTRDGLDHVVQNLIDNAVKYGGGTPVVVRAERDGKRVRLAVRDSGPGIPRGQEERIFERFYRVDAGRSRELGGSGLGLAIVKSQLEAMGGSVRVEDAGPGARFVVELDAG